MMMTAQLWHFVLVAQVDECDDDLGGADNIALTCDMNACMYHPSCAKAAADASHCCTKLQGMDGVRRHKSRHISRRT